MATPRTPRRRPEAPTFAPTTITALARTYHACAIALAKSLGLPMTAAFLQEYHSAISCVYIEASRSGVRLPPAVQLPPLVPPNGHPANGMDGTSPENPEKSEADVPDFTPPNGDAGGFPSNANQNPSNGDTPPLTVVPTEGGLPCAGQVISALKPAQLAMLISKTARLVSDGADQWVPLLHALQAERTSRLDLGRKTTGEG